MARSYNPDDGILKTIATVSTVCIGIVTAPFILIILKIIEFIYWVKGKITGE